jgi:ketopantoate hydroxymethyltransferase
MEYSVSDAADRNEAPILKIIAAEFARTRRVPEIGSGTGQHAHNQLLVWKRNA